MLWIFEEVFLEVSSLTVILGFYLMKVFNVNYSPNRSTPEGGYRKVHSKLISRQSSSSAPLSRREKWVLLGVTANLTFITWGLGGMLYWAQWTIFSLSLFGFIFCFIPVGGRYTSLTKSHSFKENIRRLIRFPGFWLAIPFLVYALIQAMNPIWALEFFAGNVFWNPVYFWDNFPTSIRAPAKLLFTNRGMPFGGMNAYLELLIFGSGILMCWTVWIGLVSKKAIRFLYWVLGVNVTFMGLFGVIQYWLSDPSSRYIYGLVWSRSEYYFGSFVYRNHAAVLLYLALGICLGLFFFYFNQARRVQKRSGPHYLLFLFSVCLSASIVVDASRGGILVMCALWVLAGLLGLTYIIRAINTNAVWALSTILIVLIGSLAFFSFVADKSVLGGRLKETIEGIHDPKSGFRYHLYQSTIKLFEDHQLYGSGGGSYRYYIPAYMTSHDAFMHDVNGVKQLKFRANYAHCDYLQLLAEYGIVGFSFISLFALYWLCKAFLLRRYFNRLSGMILLSGLMMLFHASIDFLLYSPSLLIAFSFMVVSSIRLGQLEKDRWDRLSGEG